MAKGELHVFNWLRHRPKKHKGRAELLMVLKISALYWLDQYMTESGRCFCFKRTAVAVQKG
jgi:hypothetical protein